MIPQKAAVTQPMILLCVRVISIMGMCSYSFIVDCLVMPDGRTQHRSGPTLPSLQPSVKSMSSPPPPPVLPFSLLSLLLLEMLLLITDYLKCKQGKNFIYTI